MKIGFVSTYLPTNCGIAKFNNSLEDSLALIDNTIKVARIRMTVPEDLPRNDIFINIRKYEREDYIKAAEIVNDSDIDLICLQHEYGIFGGEYGDYILTFLEHLDKPLITTFHTINPDLPEYAKMILKEIWYRSRKAVVILPDMHDILNREFGIDAQQLSKYVHIPHGVPVVDISKKEESKKRLGLEGKYVLLSFGLLVAHKGLEYVIEALPGIVANKPNVVYLIIGREHPEITKREGSYLEVLKAKVKELNLEKHVIFIEKFFEDEQELSSYLLAGDILLTPYTRLNHVSSGVIAYGMAHGMCIVATPFTFAKKNITNTFGRIVKEKDSKSISDAINSLLEGDISYMQKRAYEQAKDWQWPRIAERYLQLFNK